MIAHAKRSAGWYGDDFIFDIYLFDLEKGMRIHRKGDELNFERIIDSAFKDLVENRS